LTVTHSVYPFADSLHIFREMVRVYEDYREEKEFRRLQRYGAIRTLDRLGSEDEFFDSLYSDR